MADPIPEPDISEKLEDELIKLTDEKNMRFSEFATRETLSYVATIREKVKDIKGFWPYVLTQHVEIAELVTSSSDKEALSYLSDVELKQDPKDPRPFELIFHFAENPFFSNKTLSKKYELSPDVKPAPGDGSVTVEMRTFDPRKHLIPDAVKIEWKSPDKDLCSKHPRVSAKAHDHDAEGHSHEDHDEFDGDMGSFFWYFADASDPYDVGQHIMLEILPNAVDFYTGVADACIGGEDDEDEDDELDEEDGDDDEEIDLEDEDDQPSKKKRRTAQ